VHTTAVTWNCHDFCGYRNCRPAIGSNGLHCCLCNPLLYFCWNRWHDRHMLVVNKPRCVFNLSLLHRAGTRKTRRSWRVCLRTTLDHNVCNNRNFRNITDITLTIVISGLWSSNNQCPLQPYLFFFERGRKSFINPFVYHLRTKLRSCKGGRLPEKTYSTTFAWKFYH